MPGSVFDFGRRFLRKVIFNGGFISSPAMKPILLLIVSYMIGSLPFGLLIARWWAGIDVRDHGSGNIGATNVYRVVGKPAGVVVFVLDVLKGFLPPVIAVGLRLNEWWVVAAGLASVTGHSYSPFLGFKGGKGISTGLGVLFAIAWKAGLAAWAVWGILLAVTGYVSVGAIGAAVSLPVLCWMFYPGAWANFSFCLVASVLTLYKHRANIQRLRAGTELGFRDRAPTIEEEPLEEAPQREQESTVLPDGPRAP